MKSHFQINFLDHIALRVKDIDKSAEWYQRVLGLKKYKVKEWGEFPIFLLAGKSGIALFPIKDNTKKATNPNYDHFAFNVDGDSFVGAQKHLKELHIDFHFQDHHHFHSIYFEDPDGNKVELTTIITNPEEFY